MTIKGIIAEDFVNYKLPSLTIEFPYCTFKCDKEAGCDICQNSSLINESNIEILTTSLIGDYYINNPITKAVVMQGLEPFDSFYDLVHFISVLRVYFNCNDDVVIYTGYNKDEIEDRLEVLKRYKNIIVKFGRYIPNKESHYDEVLGVSLASPNQYAERIS